MSKNRFYKKRKKRRDTTIKPVKRSYIIIPAVMVVILAALLILVFLPSREEKTETVKFLGSTAAGIQYYVMNDEEQRLIQASSPLPRGTRVTDMDESYSENGVEYELVRYNDSIVYIPGEYLVDTMSEVIRETEVWVRTSSTVYEDKSGIGIASWAKKGSCLKVVGFDKLMEDGSINKYQVSYTDSTGEDITGWVYGKYLADNEADALAVNTSTYDIHKSRTYGDTDLHGGSAESLDWYPVEKPEFDNNPLLRSGSFMYVAIKAAKNIDTYIEIAKKYNIRGIVIDIKDELNIAYEMPEINEYSALTNDCAVYGDASVYRNAVRKCKDAGLYCVGRIVTFKDTLFAKQHPESSIESSISNLRWPSAYSRKCWEYNVTIACTAVKDCGFNEIQFDYVRFPEEAYQMSENGDADFKNTYDEEKAEAIQNFCYYASDVLHENGVYMSVDVFGECSNPYITAYGQYYPAISLVVDAISAMPYTDHYGRETDTWSDPYRTVSSWAQKTAARQLEIETPAVSRTWITAYDVPYWNPVITCDSDYVRSQVQALTDNGLECAFISWNSDSSVSKYELIGSAWNADQYTGTP
ncbi:MAG: hypothetical protein HUJ76_05930 [Parasporobacterium sp.]|nr:hypothetical protein [Parasporobacterium sp.]